MFNTAAEDYAGNLSKLAAAREAVLLDDAKKILSLNRRMAEPDSELSSGESDSMMIIGDGIRINDREPERSRGGSVARIALGTALGLGLGAGGGAAAWGWMLLGLGQDAGPQAPPPAGSTHTTKGFVIEFPE